jgi:spermidine synthase
MFGTAELVQDPWRPSGRMVTVDGVLQSYVDVEDPAHLRMPFTVWIAQVVDRHFPSGRAIDAVHVGGGGFTVPRYLAATRPGSTQTAFELDGALVELVRDHLALDSVPGLTVEVRDGRAGIEELPDASADLVVLDVFRGGEVVTELATVEFLGQIARVLRPDGLYATNLWDGDDLTFALRATASMAEVFPNVVAMSEAGVLTKLRPGNVVVAASTAELPFMELAEWARADPGSVHCLSLGQLAAVCGTAPPLTTAEPLVRPAPPVSPWGRS